MSHSTFIAQVSTSQSQALPPGKQPVTFGGDIFLISFGMVLALLAAIIKR